MSDDFFEQVGTERSERSHRTVGAEAPTPVGMENPTNPERGGASLWSSTETMFWGAARTNNRLPPGLYRCGNSAQVGPYLDRQINDTDALLRLPDSHAEDVLREITEFAGLKPAFTQRGFLFKRGVLLWGPPGSGKTCALRLLVELVIQDMGGIAIFVDNPCVAALCLQLARKIEPNRQIVALMEDIDALIERYGENEYLALLDGESQVDNIIFIATTNYPGRLDRRFVDRPSRFDTIKYVGMPSAAARTAYLAAKEPGLSAHELERYTAMSEGFSIAHLRELVILTQCFKRPLDEAVARLAKMKTKPDETRLPDSPAFGFVNEKLAKVAR